QAAEEQAAEEQAAEEQAAEEQAAKEDALSFFISISSKLDNNILFLCFLVLTYIFSTSLTKYIREPYTIIPSIIRIANLNPHSEKKVPDFSNWIDKHPTIYDILIKKSNCFNIFIKLGAFVLIAVVLLSIYILYMSSEDAENTIRLSEISIFFISVSITTYLKFIIFEDFIEDISLNKCITYVLGIFLILDIFVLDYFVKTYINFDITPIVAIIVLMASTFVIICILNGDSWSLSAANSKEDVRKIIDFFCYFALICMILSIVPAIIPEHIYNISHLNPQRLPDRLINIIYISLGAPIIFIQIMADRLPAPLNRFFKSESEKKNKGES
ncbi:MAG TPA: hypothetical protein PLM24_00735, partial [Methanothrix sp.]|nr:hypothetical protein [Methanothrix sp.]HPR65642.1 hypothetical protein [Methanothrix sp.]